MVTLLTSLSLLSQCTTVSSCLFLALPPPRSLRSAGDSCFSVDVQTAHCFFCPPFTGKLANPAPLGLFGFATTTLLLSLINVDTRDLSATPNIVICMAFAYGGLAQLLAGMWEGAAGNTFGFTAFSSYGAFWISYGIANVPWFNSASAYEDEGLLHDALGLYLMMWMIVTCKFIELCTGPLIVRRTCLVWGQANQNFPKSLLSLCATVLFLLACSRSSFSLISVFFFLTITFLLLGVGDLTGSTGAARAGGAFGIVTGMFLFPIATLFSH